MPGRHAGFPSDWPPTWPEDPGYNGDTPWAGGQPPRERIRDGLDVLDKEFPIRHVYPAAVFWKLLQHPPVKSPWRAHLDFTVAQTAAAVAQQNSGAETFVVPFDADTAPVPVIRVPVARVPYPELEPATLALEFEASVTHEFTEADQERLAAVLRAGPDATLMELEDGRSI